MTYAQFRQIVREQKKSKPILFELEHDKISSIDDLNHYEKENHIVFTEEYKRFLMEYGGGYFGYTIIYSLDENSIFYICNNQLDIPKDYLAISDNGCGDYFVLKIKAGYCEKEVLFYEHDTCKIRGIVYNDILEFLVSEGLKCEC